MEESIVISNPEKLERMKESIKKDGVEKFYAISDFDKTLTKAFVSGKIIPSLISILRDENYLTPDYAEKAHALYNKYHSIEIDPKIGKEEKKTKMREWWMVHYRLLADSGLNKKDLEKVVNSEKIKLREGFEEFADFLDKNNIPLIIVSSAGLGSDAIRMYLERNGKLYKNIYIISNSFEWDTNGNLVAVKEPIIHNANKNGETIKSSPVFSQIKDRKNILLLGDSLDDINMTEGLNFKNLIKISFLNENVEKCLEDYKLNYDIIALNDSPMFFVNKLLKEIIR